MLTHIPTNEREAQEALRCLSVQRSMNDTRPCMDVVLHDHLPEFIRDYVEIPEYEIYETEPRPVVVEDNYKPFFVKLAGL